MYYTKNDIDNLFDDVHTLFLSIGNTINDNLMEFIKNGVQFEALDHMIDTDSILLDEETQRMVKAYHLAGEAMAELDQLRCDVEDREKKTNE